MQLQKQLVFPEHSLICHWLHTLIASPQTHTIGYATVAVGLVRIFKQTNQRVSFTSNCEDYFILVCTGELLKKNVRTHMDLFLTSFLT